MNEDILSLAKECGAYELAQQLDPHTDLIVDYDGLYFPYKTLEAFAILIRAQDLARIAELEEELEVLIGTVLQLHEGKPFPKYIIPAQKALANKSNFLAEYRKKVLEEAADWFLRKDSYAWENLTRMANKGDE